MVFSINRRRLLLIAIVLLAAIIRIVAVAQPRVVWGDEPFYLWLGRSLLDGQGWQFFGIPGVHFAPFFPLAAAFIAKIAGLFGESGTHSLLVGSNALHVICGAALVLPASGIAWRLGGELAGYAAALVAAVYPALVVGPLLWGTMTEPMYLLFVALAWWALVAAVQDGNGRGFILAGALLALGYLVRSEALILLLAGFAAAFLLSVFLRPKSALFKQTALRTTGAAALGVVAFFLLITPYLVAMHAETGQWQLTDESGSAYVSARSLAYHDMATFDKATWGVDPGSGEVYVFSPASESESFTAAVRADPQGFLRVLRANVKDLINTLFSPRMVSWWLLPLIALGLFARAWDGRRLRGELMLMTVLLGPLSFLPFFIQDRYIAPALLPAVVWIGVGIVQLGEWLSASVGAVVRGDAAAGEKRPAAWIVLPLALLLAVLLFEGPRLRALLEANTASFQPAHLQIADRLRQAAGGQEVKVMSRYPAIAFHADAAWTPTPAEPWETVLAYARKHGAQYLAVDAYEAKLRPQLGFLLNGQTTGDVDKVGEVDGGRRKVVLWRIK